SLCASAPPRYLNSLPTRRSSDLDGNHADTYRAVYFVEPLSGHPSYHICRNIIVKKPVAEKQAESHADGSGTGGESEEPDSEDEDGEPQTQTEEATEGRNSPAA